MKKKQIKLLNQPGFTVVELLLYMGIFSILLVVLMQIFTSILSAHAESQATSQVQQDGSYILARLTNDIHKASTVVAPTLGTTGQTMRITGSGIDETFSQNGTDLKLTNNTSSNFEYLNSANTNVTVSFQTLGNVLSPTPAVTPKYSVQIQVTVTSKIIQPGGIQQSKTFQTTIQTR
jgi:type II secretory pathway component PulJ